MRVRYYVFLSDESSHMIILERLCISNVSTYLNVYNIHAVPGF